jgi:hypothetical protein
VTAPPIRFRSAVQRRRPQGVDVNAEPVTVRRLGLALAVAAALLTSACAAGQQAGTANELPTLNGTNASVGAIDLRGLVIESPSGTTPYYPIGSDAAIKLVLVNTGTKADQLTSITSTSFSDWGAYATTADADAVVSADAAKHAPKSSAAASSPAASSSSAPASSGSPTGRGSRPATSAASSPAASRTSSPLPVPSKSITIAPGSRTAWGTPESTGALLVLHTTKLIYPGTTISLTFTFAHAGSLTVVVPIALSSSPHSSVIPEPTTSSFEG